MNAHKISALPELLRVDDGHAADGQLQAMARQWMESNRSLRRWSKQVDFSSQGGTLRLTGRLPSFYLKQMLQTTLRDLPGCEHLENQVEVIPEGGAPS